MDELNKENIVTTDTVETGSTTDQVKVNQESALADKTFTQDDVDRIITNRLKQVERKFENINVEEYHQLKSAAEQAKEAEMMKKNQFEELLQKQKVDANTRIGKLQSELQAVHVDGALLSAASRHKAVNPDHVAALLKNNVRLNETGQVEVLDQDGNVRYDTDKASPLTVDQAVEEFLTQNNYFRTAAPAGTGSLGNKNPSTSREVKLKDLDMKNPEHRKLYKEKFMQVGMRSLT
jgi:hypothetical protein